VDRDASVYVVESPMPATMALMERGRERFAIYCIPCHGASGNGNGIVQQRAQKLIPLDMVSNWVTPTDVTTETVASQPDGQLFDSITNGIRNMPAYGPQITVEDRWAIVLFVRALQRAANATIDDVPAANRGGL
jgi:mono/diheme cytochrome c family protein